MRAGRDDRAVGVHEHHPVGEGDGRRAVGDDQRGAPAHHLGERGTDLVLLGGVDRRRGVVEDQHAGVGEDRARDGEALTLPTREGEAVLTEERLVPVGQGTDEVVGTGQPRSTLHLVAVDVVAALPCRERQVLPHGVAEEERLLEHETDLAAERAQP